MKLPLNSFTIAAAALLTFWSPWPHAVAQQGDSQTAITDLASSKHPVKAVLQRNNVKLLKVEISTNKKHPEQKYFVFYVSLPYDPRSSETTSDFNKLYAAILQGTGQSDYALQDEDDHVRIEVTWNKALRKISLDFVPLQ
jgi:ssDNA-specific exonuclease RecJ